ncbi:hypothetical protein EYZ11_007430 [Aspergillus tanneri]|uniref:Uncharacterized protein n=1 Tax=Aspergillus tanneri TaxID=1220188 RepID=A0A4S3JDD9_9EURO|nr:hypothetical protein EYZ11_007430 [Aspergillus tanneri]
MNLSTIVTISLASLALSAPIPIQYRRGLEALNAWALTEMLMPHSGIPETVTKLDNALGSE